MTGACGGDHGQGPESPGREIHTGLWIEIATPLRLKSVRKSRSSVVGETIVHEISARDQKEKDYFGLEINGGLANTETLWIGLSGGEKGQSGEGPRKEYGV